MDIHVIIIVYSVIIKPITQFICFSILTPPQKKNHLFFKNSNFIQINFSQEISRILGIGKQGLQKRKRLKESERDVRQCGFDLCFSGNKMCSNLHQPVCGLCTMCIKLQLHNICTSCTLDFMYVQEVQRNRKSIPEQNNKLILNL